MFGLIDATLLLIRLDAPAQRLEHQSDDRGENTGERERECGDHDLHDELLVVAAPEQAGVLGQEPDADGAPESCDEVNTCLLYTSDAADE